MTITQEHIDTVVRRMRDQGYRQSIWEKTGLCAYRGEGGLVCGFSALMTDEERAEAPEATLAGEPQFAAVRGRLGLSGREASYIQIAHDEGATPTRMWDGFADLCADHGLTMPADCPRPEVGQ
jgi:hypothetical protein